MTRMENEMKMKRHKICSPTTSRSLVAIPVWNEGASADTSQLYFPVTIGCTVANVTWLSFDMDRYNEKWRKWTELVIRSKCVKGWRFFFSWSHIRQLMWRSLRTTRHEWCQSLWKNKIQWLISCRLPRHGWRRLIKAYFTFAYVHNFHGFV